MPTSSYKSSQKKRIFTNSPFRYGMAYSNEMTRENLAKVISNMDIIGSGDVAVPRPSFVNSIIHNDHSAISLNPQMIKQVSRDGKPFLISFEHSVTPEDFKSGALSPNKEIKDPFGMNIVSMKNQVQALVAEEGLRYLKDVTIIDGDTVIAKDWTTNELITFRLLGLDTPELNVLPIAEGEYAVVEGSPTRLYKNVSDNIYTTANWQEIPYETITDLTTYQNYYFTNGYTHIFYNNNFYWGNPGFIAKNIIVVNYDSIAVYEDNLALEAKNKLTEIVGLFEFFAAIYDPKSSYQDIYGRDLVHLVGWNRMDWDPTVAESIWHSINGFMLAHGLGDTKYITPEYMFYTEYMSLEQYAKDNLLNIWDPNPEDGVNVFTNETILANNTQNIDFVDSNFLGVGEFEESNSTKHFRKPVDDTHAINSGLYTTEEYFSEEKTASFAPNGETIWIEILRHDYSNSEYHLISKSTEYPYVNIPWQNAVVFIGRIIQGGTVIYKGLITLQYDGESHYILMQEPVERHLGMLNLEDVYSMSFNAMDDDPFFYEDYFGADAGAFVRPTILGVYLYKGTKILKSVGTKQECYIRPFIVHPNISKANFSKTEFRYIFEGQKEDEVDWINTGLSESDVLDPTIIENKLFGPSGVIPAAGKRTDWDFSEAQGGGVKFEYRTTFENYDAPVTTTSAELHTTVSIAEDRVPSDVDMTHEVSVKAIPKSWSTITTNVYSHVVEIQLTIDGIKYSSQHTIVNNKTDNNLDGYLFLKENYFNIDLVFQNANIGVSTSTPTATMVVEHEEWIAKGVTYPIFNNGEAFIDEMDMLKDHNVWEATHVTSYDRSLVVYGEAMGNHSLQFTESETTNDMPFPSGQIQFDSKIIHVHSHLGNLYVFCEDGIWVLHSGFDYKTLLKTFAYSGVQLHPSEKQTVVSVGNEVFFMHDSRGYVIRSNYQVQSSEDIYVMPLTTSINKLLNNPIEFLRERLQDAYGVLVESTTMLTCNYRSIVRSENLFIVASYSLGSVKNTLMVMYIYEKDYKRFRIYDTYVGAFPILEYHASTPNNFGLILQNSLTNPKVTAAEFMYYLPENVMGYELGDARPYSFIDGTWQETDRYTSISKVQGFLDTGGLGLNSLHKKRVRRFVLTITNFEGEELSFNMIPYADGIMIENATNIQAVLDAYGDIIEQADPNVKIIVPTITKFITFAGLDVPGFVVAGDYLTTYKYIHLETHINVLGKLPGFKVYLPAQSRFETAYYGIVYRQYMAR